MKTVKLYARVRRAVLVDGISRRAATREFGLHPTDEDLSTGTPFEAYFHAFEYFGGIPTRILYDNTKQTVARGLGDGQRQKTRTFSELQRHYLFAEKFGQPAKGNDKPGPYGQVFIRGVGSHGLRSAALSCSARAQEYWIRLCRIEHRLPRLDMANWPYLPLPSVRTTHAADYMSLLCAPAAEPPTLEATL